MRDLGDAFVLFDARDPEPFWNRMASVRWPTARRRVRPPAGGGARVVRRPRPGAAHLAVATSLARPRTSWRGSARTASSDAGGGHVMVLEDPGTAATPVPPDELGARRDTAHAIARPARTRGRGDLDDVGLVLAESFGALPGRAAELAADLRLTLTDDPGRCSCWRGWTGSPPRPPRRRRSTGSPTCRRSGRARRSGAAGWRGIVTRHAMALGGRGSRSRVPRRVLGQRAGAAGVRASSGSPRSASRRTCCSNDALGARLTWQAADPATFAPALAARLGVDGTGRRRARRRARGCSTSGSAWLEVRPWLRGVAHGRSAAPAGGCCWRPSVAASRRPRTRATRRRAAVASRPLRLAGPRLGDRRARPGRRRARHVARARRPTRTRPDAADPLLAARARRARRRRAAGRRGCVLLEPSTEGRLRPRRSPATARVPRALYLRPAAGLDALGRGRPRAAA